MSRKKILYVQHSGASGGAPMSLFYLLQYVVKQYDVVVYFICDGPAVDFYRENGIECRVARGLRKLPHCTIESQSLNPLSWKFYSDLRVYARHWPGLWSSYHEMRSIIKDERPDIVHLNSSVLVAEGLAARHSGIPLIWHMRDFLEKGVFGLRRHLISRVILGSATKIVALCESEAARLGVSDKIEVIPNFVHLEKFSPDCLAPVHLRKTLGCSKDVKIVAMLGWSIPGKGAITAVNAMQRVVREIPDSVLVLFGTGAVKGAEDSPLFARIKRLIKPKSSGVYKTIQSLTDAFDMNGKVLFAGTVFDMPSYLNEVDVVLVPFTVPHFARPILEAGAMRKVVVTSDLDGTREMVLDGKAGYLARPGDAGNLAGRIVDALREDNSDKLELMYRNVVENYNAEKNARRTMRLYEDL